MKYYAIIDTNVLVSALLSKNNSAATVQLLERLLKGEIIPVYNQEIIKEYEEVLKRKKFKFSEEYINYLLLAIQQFGLCVQAKSLNVQLPDMGDLPFYEVVMEERGRNAYLVTGNLKHFPKRVYIVTARQMLDILDEK